jgi:Ca2+-binding EF-hand superfamily protein
LIEATNSDCIDDNSVKKVLREYNENLNPIRFYWNDWHIWFGTVIELAGVFGKGSENLLSKSTTLYDDDDDNSIDREEIYNYYYQLDEDGYPSVINIITTYSNSMIERSVTYQLTYTN